MESQETQRVKISHMTSLIIYGETFLYIHLHVRQGLQCMLGDNSKILKN